MNQKVADPMFWSLVAKLSNVVVTLGVPLLAWMVMELQQHNTEISNFKVWREQYVAESRRNDERENQQFIELKNQITAMTREVIRLQVMMEAMRD